MTELIDYYFWTGTRFLAIILMLIYGKRILHAIGGSDGWDKKDVGSTFLMALGTYMVIMEGSRTDLAHQLYSDWLYGIIFVSAILGFGIKDILKVIQIIGTKGYAKQEGQQPDEPTN